MDAVHQAIRKMMDCRSLVAMDLDPDDGSPPVHLPHAPAFWAIAEYNHMLSAYAEEHQELLDASGAEALDSTTRIELRARYVQHAIVAAFLTGVKYGAAGHKIDICDCGTLQASTLEELNDGAWSKPAND